jgi:pimeloyl-ACP methyl ester carboxylesterase
MKIEDNVATMTKRNLFPVVFAAWAGLALSVSSGAQQPPSAITSDPARDQDLPAAMEAPDIISHGARLNAVFYVASGAGPHPVVLLLHGFPGNEQNMDLAYAMRRAGWNVLVPHYRGSWGSAGAFSFSNAIEDTQAAVQFLRAPANAKEYRTDASKIVIVGHSMGGFLGSYATAHDPAILGVAMISAWNLGPAAARPESEHRTMSFHDASPRLAGTTPEGMLTEAKQNAGKWNYVDWAPELKTRSVLVVESTDGNVLDNKAMAEALRKAGDAHVTEIAVETDHVYSDHRIALQAAVLGWLQSFGITSSK